MTPSFPPRRASDLNFPAKKFLAAPDPALLLRRPFQYLPDEFSPRIAAHVVGDVLALHAIFRDEPECVEFQRPRFRMTFIDTANRGIILRPMQVLYDGEASVVPLDRSEEQPSELQSLMRISYSVFCLNKNNNTST